MLLSLFFLCEPNKIYPDQLLCDEKHETELLHLGGSRLWLAAAKM